MVTKLLLHSLTVVPVATANLVSSVSINNAPVFLETWAFCCWFWRADGEYQKLSFYLVAPLLCITASQLSTMMKPTASECNKFPCVSMLTHTESHQADVDDSYCCVGFSLPFLPVCKPKQFTHQRFSVHLSRCLWTGTFNTATGPIQGDRLFQRERL